MGAQTRHHEFVQPSPPHTYAHSIYLVELLSAVGQKLKMLSALIPWSVLGEYSIVLVTSVLRKEGDEHKNCSAWPVSQEIFASIHF